MSVALAESDAPPRGELMNGERLFEFALIFVEGRGRSRLRNSWSETFCIVNIEAMATAKGRSGWLWLGHAALAAGSGLG